MAVTRKDLGAAPYFEERGHIVSPAEPVPDQELLLDVTCAAHLALGVDWGVTHTEIRMGPGGPRVIEVAARAAGDLIPLLVRLSTGVDLMTDLAAVLTGAEAAPAVAPAAAAAGVRFALPPHDLVFQEVCGPLLVDPPPWLRDFVLEARAGELLRLPPHGYLNRVGYAVVTGADAAECRRRLDLWESQLEINGDHPRT